jgi:glycosyltransferase involved in cell wall biosynthesis
VEDIGVAAERGRGDPPLVSVVLPVRNGMPWLDAQLQALSGQEVSARWEIIVSDNGSEDGTRACVEKWSERDSRIHLVDASIRRGAAAARNIGVQSAGGGLLVFCDADDVVRPGWIASMEAAMANADLVAGVFDFGALDGNRGPGPVPAATRQLGFLPFGLSANLAIRTEVFASVQGFDEQLAAGEDVDLCWRVQLAGYRFALATDAVVEKRERAAGMPTFRAGWAYGQCGPRLYGHYRSLGMRRDLRGAAKAWGWLAVTLPALISRPRRRQWVRVFAIRTGRLSGSIHHRSFFP